MSDIIYKEKTFETSWQDPLLECLVLITQLQHTPCTHEALRAGLPLVDNLLTPETFIRAAERAGMAAKLIKRPLKDISPLVLPVVLLLKNNAACVLTQVSKGGSCEVIFPETGAGAARLNLTDLQLQYTGYVFFVQPQHEFETRAQETVGLQKPRSWFWGTLWRFRNYYFQVILASLFVNLFALAIPLFTMNVYDRVVPNNATDTLWVLASGVTIVFGFDFLMRMLRSYFIDLAGKKVDIIIASNLFEQALGVKMYAKPASTGVQANHLRDFENIRDFFTSATISTITDLPFVILYLFVIYLVSGWLVIIPALAVPIMVLSGILISVPMRRSVEKTFTGSAQKHAILIEALNNLDVIKSVSAEGTMQGRWEKFVGLSANAALKTRFYSTLAVNVSTFIQYIVSIAVVIIGVYMIEDKLLTTGGLIATTILSGRAIAPLALITGLLTRYQLTKFSYKALNDVMELPIERPYRHKFLHRPKFDGAIEFEDVWFKYPDQPTELFKGISFNIKAKEKVAIIGSMGAGKSTLLKLIMGFYVPAKGAIRIDGTDIAQIDPADLRRHIGFVQQEPKLFYGTARDNITMKAPWVDDSVVLECARLAGADTFISKHPAGYDMPIGEGGLGLSGGQCQTITIARSLLLSPSILLFDEPTSSMDNSAELFFLENLKKYYEDKTLILVTHKMTLLTVVDRLLVIQNGKIVADGDRDRVLEALKQLQKVQGS